MYVCVCVCVYVYIRERAYTCLILTIAYIISATVFLPSQKNKVCLNQVKSRIL